MNKLLTLGVGLAAIGLGLMSFSAALADHAWNGNHWPSSEAGSLGVENQAGGEYQVAETIGDWNGLGTPVQMTLGGGSDIVVRSRNMNAWYLGLAEIKVDPATGHILEGRVTLNDRYLKDGNLYGFDSADRLSVLCQEVGHVIGLGHTHQYTDTCMNDQLVLTGDGEQVSPTQLAGTTPNNHDREQLNLIYDHVDGGGAEPPSNGGGGGPPCDKNPDHPRCTGAGVWITIHVVPAPQP